MKYVKVRLLSQRKSKDGSQTKKISNYTIFPNLTHDQTRDFASEHHKKKIEILPSDLQVYERVYILLIRIQI